VSTPAAPTREFERYEVWLTPGLGAKRTLQALTDDLESAQAAGDSVAADYEPVRHAMVGIDYIALHDEGRTERFWVRQLQTGVWLELGSQALEAESPTI
jgi:hypothetical protein